MGIAGRRRVFCCDTGVRARVSGWPRLLGVAKKGCYAVLIYNLVCFALTREVISIRQSEYHLTGELLKAYEVSSQTSSTRVAVLSIHIISDLHERLVQS